MGKRTGILAGILSLSLLMSTGTAVQAVVQRGDQGDEVQYVQELLIEYGILTDNADGVFGPNTENAVRSYQRAAGLVETGIADTLTVNRLYYDVQVQKSGQETAQSSSPEAAAGGTQDAQAENGQGAAQGDAQANSGQTDEDGWEILGAGGQQGQSGTQEGQAGSTEGQSGTPEGQAGSSEGQSGSPEGQADNAEGEQESSDGQEVDVEGLAAGGETAAAGDTTDGQGEAAKADGTQTEQADSAQTAKTETVQAPLPEEYVPEGEPGRYCLVEYVNGDVRTVYCEDHLALLQLTQRLIQGEDSALGEAEKLLDLEKEDNAYLEEGLREEAEKPEKTEETEEAEESAESEADLEEERLSSLKADKKLYGAALAASLWKVGIENVYLTMADSAGTYEGEDELIIALQAFRLMAEKQRAVLALHHPQDPIETELAMLVYLEDQAANLCAFEGMLEEEVAY